MSATKKVTRASHDVWLTRDQAARAARLSVDRFDAAIRSLVPDSETKKSGRRVLMSARAVVDAIVAHRSKVDADPRDPLLVGGDSPSLERYRAARADMVELELEKTRGTHIDVRALESTIVRFSDRLRSTGELLQRKFGNDASEMFNDGITAAADAAKRDLTRA